MILIDTNIFIIDRFFPNDAHYDANKAFVGKLDSLLDNSLDNHFIWLWTKLFAVMSKRMTYVDALLLALAESLEAECIVTWNKRDFEGRTEEVSVLNPEDFIAKIGKEREESEP